MNSELNVDGDENIFISTYTELTVHTEFCQHFWFFAVFFSGHPSNASRAIFNSLSEEASFAEMFAFRVTSSFDNNSGGALFSKETGGVLFCGQYRFVRQTFCYCFMR